MGMNILVCDDQQEIVEAIEIYLKNEGYEIFKAYDGQEALEVLDRETDPSDHHGCDDAQDGRHPGHFEDPGKRGTFQ